MPTELPPDYEPPGSRAKNSDVLRGFIVLLGLVLAFLLCWGGFVWVTVTAYHLAIG